MSSITAVLPVGILVLLHSILAATYRNAPSSSHTVNSILHILRLPTNPFKKTKKTLNADRHHRIRAQNDMLFRLQRQVRPGQSAA